MALHRQGTLFDIPTFDCLSCPAEDRRWGIELFLFDASSGELRPEQAWTLPSSWPNDQNGFLRSAWWRGALPLLARGFSFTELAQRRKLVALAGGLTVWAKNENPLGHEASAIRTWQIVDSQGGIQASFDAPAPLSPLGEIRPGLLLLGYRPQVDWYGLQGPVAYASQWELLVVAVPTGKVLRRLEGFAALTSPDPGRRIWLVNRLGEPFDLASADAEPQRILPWRALGRD